MNTEISKTKLNMILLTFFMFINVIISFAYLSDNSPVKYALLLIFGLLCLRIIKVVLKRKFLLFNTLVFIMCFLILLFSYFNIGSVEGRNTFLAAIIFVAKIPLSVIVVEYAVETHQLPTFINCIFWLLLLTVFITDFLALAIGSISGNYFIGTKFSVAYLHLQTIVFFLIRVNREYNLKRKLFLIAFIIFTIGMTIYVDCNTSLLGLGVMVVLLLLIKAIKKVVVHPLTAIICVLLSFSMVYIIDVILNNSLIQYIIVDILNGDLTLTSRTRIFTYFTEVMQGHWLMGYGYGSEYEIVMNFIGAADIQNGLASWFLQHGIIVTSLFLILIVYSYYKGRKSGNYSVSMCAIMLYVYIFMAIGEITFSINFIFWLILLYGTSFYESNKCKNCVYPIKDRIHGQVLMNAAD